MKRILEFGDDEGTEFNQAVHARDMYVALFNIRELCVAAINDEVDVLVPLDVRALAQAIIDDMNSELPNFEALG